MAIPRTQGLNRRLNSGLLVLLFALFALALTGCTAGSLRGSTDGWSPVSALVIPVDSGVKLETGLSSPLDNTLTITNRLVFEPGQVIQIDQEQMLITSIRDDELTVNRGVNGTRAQLHPSQSSISLIGEQFVVFITTKQGVILPVVDDGTGDPQIGVPYSPPGASR